MPRRIFSPKVLELNIPIRLLRAGCISGHKKEGDDGKVATANGHEVHLSVLKTYLKIGVAEQGWEMNSTDTIYITAVLNICPVTYKSGRKDKATGKRPFKTVVDMDKVRKVRMSVCSPSVKAYTSLLLKAMKDIVFEKDNQVVAITVIRRYNTRDGIDLLIGATHDWRELIHDLRNA